MFLGRHGGGWQVYDKNQKCIAFEYGRQSVPEHLANFVECIRSRQKPNSDIERDHKSTVLIHLSNISYRVGGHKLDFDAKTETIKNSPEANKLLKGKYRKPWVIPETV
jgi:hypothetical protein